VEVCDTRSPALPSRYTAQRMREIEVDSEAKLEGLEGSLSPQLIVGAPGTLMFRSYPETIEYAPVA